MVIASKAQLFNNYYFYYVTMSSTRHNRLVKTENTPFCGTCKNAGRPYSEYTSHFTKSVPGPRGIVTCPLILNSVCGNCQQRGHFTNFCSNTFVSPTVPLPVPLSTSRWQKPAASSTANTLPSSIAPSWKKPPVIAAKPTFNDLSSSFKRVKLNSSAAVASTNVFDALNDDDDYKVFTPLHISNADFVGGNECKGNVTMRITNAQRCKKPLPVDEFPALAPVKKAQPTAWVTDHKFDPTVALKPPTVRTELVVQVPVLRRTKTVDIDEDVFVPANDSTSFWFGQKALSGNWADYEDDEEY